MASMPLLASAAGQPSVTSNEPRQLARLAQIDEPHDHAGHARGDALAVLRRQRLARHERDTERSGDLHRGRLNSREAGRIILHDQPAADRDGTGGKDAAVLDQGEFGRAAADIHVEQRGVMAARERDGAGAVRGHLAFHVVAGRGADELAGLLGEEIGDGARVVALERLAGEDDGAAVDRLGLDPGIGVAAADEARELVDIDGVVGAIGREQDRGLPEDFSADHDEAARQRGREPLQVDAREHQVRGGGSDIDPDRGQLHIVGGPGDLVDRGVLGTDVQVLEFEIVHCFSVTAYAASLMNLPMPDFTPYFASSDR